MQSCIFRSVDTYLDERGVDTAAYERQATAVMTGTVVEQAGQALAHAVATWLT
jgi:hypothetical protein